MDNRTVFAKVKKMIEELDQKEITLFELENLIMLNIGSAPSTISTALKTLSVSGLLKDIGNSRFKVIRK